MVAYGYLGLDQYIDGLMQEIRKSSALVMGLRILALTHLYVQAVVWEHKWKI